MAAERRSATMSVNVRRWLKSVLPKIEAPSVRAGRRRPAGLAVLVGGAVICWSLAVTTAWSPAGAQGQVGEGLRSALPRTTTKAAERAAAQRVKEKHRRVTQITKAAERAAARSVKAKQRRVTRITKAAERAAAQRVKEKQRRIVRVAKSAEHAASQRAKELNRRRNFRVTRAAGWRWRAVHRGPQRRAGVFSRRPAGHIGMAGFHRTRFGGRR
jgi:hypothetical protein